MSTLSFSANNSIHRSSSVAYKMVPSIREVYAQRTSLSSENSIKAASGDDGNDSTKQRSSGQSTSEDTLYEDTSSEGVSSEGHAPEQHTSPQYNSSQQALTPHTAASHTAEQDSPKQPAPEQSPNRFSHLLSIMPAGVVVIDHRGIVSLANQQASSLLEEPLEGELWRDVIGRAFRPQADDGHEVSMRNGKRVKIDISPLTEEKGQLIVITDLTETRQLQHRLSHMQRLSSLGKMVATLAHQVRTPLSSAMLYAENIKSMQPADSITGRFSQKLILRLKDLESQVNDMLLFAKSGDNHIVKAMTAEEVAAVGVQNIEAQFVQSGVQLNVVNTDKEAPVLCNLTALSGAISNLLGNALQAVCYSDSPQQSVTLEVSRQNVEQKDYVVFTVTDTGPGINEQAIQRMFEPFYTTKSQGTGLGLAVVNTVTKAHKGFVHCANRELEKGAVFSMFIPVTPPMHSDSGNCGSATATTASEASQKSQPLPDSINTPSFTPANNQGVSA